MTEAAERLARRAVDTDGRELIEPEGGFAHLLRMDGGARFPVGDDSAQAVANGFLMAGRALINATYPRRRAIIAGALLGLTIACQQLLVERAETEAGWRTGERPD
jgi:hypothetical protein